MTCFWDGNINAIMRTFRLAKRPSPYEFVQFLQRNNRRTINVLWNGNRLTEKEMMENMERVRSLDINTITRGYDCSTCDPFLLLIADIFKVHVIHNYNGHKITYQCMNCDNTTLKFSSDRGHFWHA